MNLMKYSYFVLLLSLVTLFGSFQIAYAGGSGSEESDVLFINENYLKVALETNPSVFRRK